MHLIINQLQTIPSNHKQATSSLDFQFYVHHENGHYDPDELTKENILKQDEFSKSLEIPHVFGTFNNDQHYLETLRFVLASTHETHNRILFCVNKILPLIPNEGSLLDIGPGDGSLTKILAPHFKDITMVDTNHLALSCIKELLPPTINSKQIVGSILNVDLKSDQYHLAVLSHMLYYIEPRLWLQVINSVYRSLKEQGMLVIIMGGDELGKSDLIHHFGGDVLGINPLAKQCGLLFGANNVSLYASDESFITYSQEGMLHILGFMLADANISASKNDLNSYITQNLQKTSEHFEMTTRQKYIIIKKNEPTMDE